MRRIIQETASLRKNKINRIFETNEEDPEKDSTNEIPNWVNRIQQNHNQQQIIQRNMNNTTNDSRPNTNYNNSFRNNNLVCDSCDVPGHAW